jgi:outer membrane protein OmpA-like peptidoglycan-associated protein
VVFSTPPYQETTPYLTPDKRHLYFSSNRPGGPGGNDIYKSERLDYTWLNWSKPELVKGEVNSKYDDSQPYFDPAARYMYFTSRRDGTSDIFRQQLFERPRLKHPVVVKGKIINTKSNQLTRSEVYWGQLAAPNYLEFFNSYSGEFMVTLTEFEPYKFQLHKPNHTAPRIVVDPRLIEKQGKDTIEIIFYLQPGEIVKDSIVVLDENPAAVPDVQSLPGSTIAVERSKRYEVHFPDPFQNKDTTATIESNSSFYDIYFAKSRSIFLPKSDNALNALTTSMKVNLNLEIMIIGHTDNIGDGNALVELSNQRAEAVKKWLVQHGIESSRVHTFGVGAADPLYENTTESNRERNRRVEIIVMKQ